jgi:chromodomain-helicase-DNA-binding protein 4
MCTILKFSLIPFSILSQTPLNNNIRELFNLMNFLDPNEWGELERLEKEYQELTEDLVKGLHNRLRPYFLRRLKGQVLQLPPKVRICNNVEAHSTQGA